MHKELTSEKASVPEIMRINQILIDMGVGLRRCFKYLEMSLLFLLVAILLWYSLQFLTAPWVGDPDKQPMMDILNAATYLFPLIFAALSIASLITGLAVNFSFLLIAGIEILYLRIKNRRVAGREK